MKNYIKIALYSLFVILYSCRCKSETIEISIYKNNTEHSIKLTQYKYDNLEDININLDKGGAYQVNDYSKILTYHSDSVSVLWDDMYYVTHAIQHNADTVLFFPTVKSLFNPDIYKVMNRTIGKCGHEVTRTYTFTEEDYEYAKSLNQTN